MKTGIYLVYNWLSIQLQVNYIMKISGKMLKVQNVVGSRLRGGLIEGPQIQFYFHQNMFKEQRVVTSSVRRGLVV